MVEYSYPGCFFFKKSFKAIGGDIRYLVSISYRPYTINQEINILKNRQMKQAGIALISVLWLLVVIVLIAMTYSLGLRTELLLAANIKNHTQALNLAEEGIWRGAMLILTQQSVSLDGSVIELATEQGRLSVSLQVSDGLVDLNRAPPEVLQRLFERVTNNPAQAVALRDALLDWRDVDDTPRQYGAEYHDYADADYVIKNGMLNSVDELRRVKGVTQEIYDRLLPLVTVYSGQARIAIDAAPAEVIMSLPGMDNARSNSLLNLRASARNIDYLSFVPVETKRYIGVGTREFIHISSVAEFNGARAGVSAVMQMKPQQGSPVTVVSWREKIAGVFEQG